MAYYINGRRMDYSEAVVYLANLVHDMIACEWDEIVNAVRDFLFSIRPGTGRVYANARISCAIV